MHGNMTLTDPKLLYHLAQSGQKHLGAAIAIFMYNFMICLPWLNFRK